MDLFVTFLGTAASVPTAGRSTSATLISRGGVRWLVDCGEGAQRQLLRSGIGLIDLDAIFLTHLHADHYLGLPGLLKSYTLREREAPLGVFGPPGLEQLLRTLRPLIGRLSFDLEIAEASAGLLLEESGSRVEAFPTAHSIPSIGIALVEATRPGEFDVDAACGLGVPEGPLFGRLQRGEMVTTPAGDTVAPAQVLGPARPSRSVVLSGDTLPCEMTANAARGATLLVHEATFLDEDRERAAETQHSTAGQAAELAAEAGVGLLALTHLSSRVSPRDAEQEAAARFSAVVVPRDFEQLELPYPERGEPILTDLRARSRREPVPPEGAATVPDE